MDKSRSSAPSRFSSGRLHLGPPPRVSPRSVRIPEPVPIPFHDSDMITLDPVTELPLRPRTRYPIPSIPPGLALHSVPIPPAGIHHISPNSNNNPQNNNMNNSPQNHGNNPINNGGIQTLSPSDRIGSFESIGFLTDPDGMDGVVRYQILSGNRIRDLRLSSVRSVAGFGLGSCVIQYTGSIPLRIRSVQVTAGNRMLTSDEISITGNEFRFGYKCVRVEHVYVSVELIEVK